MGLFGPKFEKLITTAAVNKTKHQHDKSTFHQPPGFIFSVVSPMVYAQDILINKDTVINKNWNIPPGTILKFGSKGNISGAGTIRGGIIGAALGQWIFYTTLT